MAAALGEVSDRKDTWSDEFLVATRAYFGMMDMLETTKEQSEENVEKKTTWTTVPVDFETATATKIPTEGFAKGVKLRFGTKDAEYMTKWLQKKPA